MRAIKITITADHIRRGERGSECNCPIALALKETLITNTVSVNATGIHINHYPYNLDEKDRKFMERFDKGWSVKGYSFWLGR